ncbi:MAG: ElyC/SanA/YdcF family protein [Pseudomonadota bacterium]
MKSTAGEAMMLREVVKKGGYRSLILVTSPTHSRRAWLTYRKAFEDEKIRIIMHPSHYSGFRPNDWWKKRRYIREVLIEYEKLMYYAVRYFL